MTKSVRKICFNNLSGSKGSITFSKNRFSIFHRKLQQVQRVHVGSHSCCVNSHSLCLGFCSRYRDCCNICMVCSRHQASRTGTMWTIATSMWTIATSVWAIVSSAWATASSMWDAVVSVWSAQALWGTFQALDGIHRCHVGYCKLWVG